MRLAQPGCVAGESGTAVHFLMARSPLVAAGARRAVAVVRQEPQRRRQVLALAEHCVGSLRRRRHHRRFVLPDCAADCGECAGSREVIAPPGETGLSGAGDPSALRARRQRPAASERDGRSYGIRSLEIRRGLEYLPQGRQDTREVIEVESPPINLSNVAVETQKLPGLAVVTQPNMRATVIPAAWSNSTAAAIWATHCPNPASTSFFLASTIVTTERPQPKDGNARAPR